MFKLLLPKKITERIHVYRSYEELYEHIDKKILPVEYGGEEPPLTAMMGG